MQRIVVINPKGGCGKTTLSTNLASYFSHWGKVTTLMDLDPQGSSVFWAHKRPDTAPYIQLVDAHHAPQNVTRSWAIQPPRNTQVLVLDTPARPDLNNLSPLLREATAVLLPVLTAEFDLHAIATTVQQLRRMLPSKQTIAMVLNRVPRTVTTARQTEALAKQFQLPVIGSLRNSCNYLNAASQGLGMIEMRGAHYKGDQKDIARIAEWCADKTSDKPVRQFRQISPETIALACSA